MLDGSPGWPLETTLYVDAQLALVDDMLHYFDRASMAHSLEVRVPFLDHHLVEYCATIPDEPQGPRAYDASTCSGQVAQGIVPDRGAREDEDRLLHRGDGHVVPGAGGRSDRRSICSTTTRGMRRSSIRAQSSGSFAAESLRERHDRLLVSILMLEVLAPRLPAARDRDRTPSRRADPGRLPDVRDLWGGAGWW